MKTIGACKFSAQRMRPWLSALTALLLYSAEAQAGPKPITKCGEIKATGFYILKNDLTGSATGCLKISAFNVTLDGNHKKITGVGSGTGLLIKGSSVFFNEVTIKNFAIGIEVDGANAFGDTFFAQSNLDTGLFLNGATGGKFHTFNADHSGNINVHLKSASGNVLLFGTTFGGGKFDFWFDSSSNNTSHSLSASGCSNTGIYLGCSSTGPGGQCAAGPSNGNRFADASVSNCPIGIAIDTNSLGNVITGLGANTAQDKNLNCSTNLWFSNNITTADQACEN